MADLLRFGFCREMDFLHHRIRFEENFCVRRAEVENSAIITRAGHNAVVGRETARELRN